MNNEGFLAEEVSTAMIAMALNLNRFATPRTKGVTELLVVHRVPRFTHALHRRT